MAERRNCIRFRIHIRIGTHRIAADTGPAFRTPVVVGRLSAVMAFAAVNGTAIVAEPLPAFLTFPLFIIIVPVVTASRFHDEPPGVLFVVFKTDTRRGFEHENPTLRNPVLGTGTGIASHTGRFALQTERSKAADKNHVTLEAVVENTPEQVMVISKFGYGDTFLHPVLLHLEMLLKLCSIIKN